MVDVLRKQFGTFRSHALVVASRDFKMLSDLRMCDIIDTKVCGQAVRLKSDAFLVRNNAHCGSVHEEIFFRSRLPVNLDGKLL